MLRPDALQVRVEVLILSVPSKQESVMQEQILKDQKDLVRPFARLNARVIPQEEIDRFGYVDGMKVGFLTTTAWEPEVG